MVDANGPGVKPTSISGLPFADRGEVPGFPFQRPADTKWIQTCGYIGAYEYELLVDSGGPFRWKKNEA